MKAGVDVTVDWRLITLYTAIQMIKSGTTTVMYNHPRTPTEGMVEECEDVLRGFGGAGMRTAFSVYYRGQNRVVYHDDDAFLSGLPADLSSAVRQYVAATDLSEDEYFSFFQSFRESHGPEASGGLVSMLLSPSNVQWASDEFFFRTKELAAHYGAAVHMHLVESWYQKEFGIRTWGKTPVAHLADLGFLGPELSCAHSVWLTESDIELLARRRHHCMPQPQLKPAGSRTASLQSTPCSPAACQRRDGHRQHRHQRRRRYASGSASGV